MRIIFGKYMEAKITINAYMDMFKTLKKLVAVLKTKKTEKISK